MSNTKRRMTTTLSSTLADDLEKNAATAGIPMNTIIEDALRLYWGEAEPMMDGRRKLVMQALALTKKRAA